MAKNIEEILNREIKSVKDLRNAIKEYQDSLIGVDAESEEFKNTTEMLRAAQDELTKVTRAGKDAMDAASDSIVGMEKEYKALYNQYKLLDEAQRNSDFGKNMAESLKELSDKINETKKGVGNFKDNIGRYTESIMDAFKQMGGSVGGLVGPFATATKGVQAFNTTLKANPIGAVVSLIMGLVTALKQLTGSIKNNEESQMRLNQAMASFQPIIDAAQNAMDKFGQAVVSVIEFLAKIVDKIRVAKAAFTDFLGITKGAKEAVKEQIETYQDLAKSVNELTKTKREYQKLNASDKAEVERLREEASETTNLAEKKKLLEEAKAKQEEIDNRNIEIAKEELRILEEQSKLTANDAAMNDKLAAAVAAVSQAEATAAANARMFNKQLNGTTTAASSAAGAIKNYREEARKIYERTIDDAKSEVQKLKEKYDEEKKLLEKYGFDTTNLTRQYQEQVDKIFTDTAKEAAEKSSKEYIERANAIINANVNFIDDLIGDDMQNAANELERFQGKLKIFKENMVNLMTFNEKDIDVAESIKQIINDLNEIMGVEIPFPELSQEGLTKFFNQLEEAGIKMDAKVKEMEASLNVKRLEAKLNEYYETWLQGTIELTQGLGQNMSDPDTYEAILELRTRDYLNKQKEMLEEMLQIENLGADERISIMERYYDVLSALREMDLSEEEKAVAEKLARYQLINDMANDVAGIVTDSTGGLINMANGYKTLYKAQIEEGKLNEKEVEKRKKRMETLEKVVRDATIAQIAANTAAGMVSTWIGYITETSEINPRVAKAAGLGSLAALAALNAISLGKAIAKTAGLAATAAGQIAAARGGYISNVSSLRGDGGGDAAAASVSAPVEIESQPFTYARTVQTFEEEDRLNQPIFVSVTDIDNVQNRVRVTENESSW